MPRKGENIYKRKDGRWEGRYIKGHSNNRAQYGYVYAKTYSDTKRLLSAKQADIANGFVHAMMPEERKPFSYFAGLWLSESQTSLKESTIAKYRNLLKKYILPALAEEDISAIDYTCLTQFCTQLISSGGAKKQGLSEKTVSDTLCVIKAIIKYASRIKYPIDRSALDVAVKLKTKHLRVFSMQEQTILLEQLVRRDTLIDVGILISLFSGIRVGELCALTWGDISTCERVMYIHKTMQRIQTPGCEKKTKILISEPKSTCSIRTVPLPQILLELLPTPAEKDSFVLTGKKNKFVEPRTMENRFQKLLHECDIENATFHTLRHTFATRCIEVGFDIKSLSEILGHANVNITLNRYVHPSMELKQRNISKLSELFAVK